MDTTSLQSTLNKAREQFENGHAKACVETLKGVLGDLKVGEPDEYRLKNDVTLYLGKFNSLERERGFGVLSQETYMLEWNKLHNGTLQLLLDFEAGVKEMGEAETDLVEEPCTYPAELMLEGEYGKMTLVEINDRLLRIEKILQTNLHLSKRVTGTRPGSVIVEMDLYAEEIVKIKSLVKLGLLKGVLSLKVLDDAWDWIEGEGFVLWLRRVDLNRVKLDDYPRGSHFIGINLNGADLIGADLGSTNLRRANLSGADLSFTNLIGADLSFANLSKADFIGAYLIGAYLIGAYLRGANFGGAYLRGANLGSANLGNANLGSADLRGANLRFTDLRGANLKFTDLRGANLGSANLIGADLSIAKLTSTIFHEKQRELLESMNVDMSKVIFVDDDMTNVESLVEAK